MLIVSILGLWREVGQDPFHTGAPGPVPERQLFQLRQLA